MDRPSAGRDVIVLHNGPDLLTTSPIANGDFSAGLTGWTADGPVSAGGGFAQLLEGDGLLTSLQQTFVVPLSPQQITFDIVALGLEDPEGGVPDAFEVSLLDAAGESLVPTFRPEATSFFNANPGGDVRLASGVSFDGRRVTLDISGLTPGTEATLIFDLVGNPRHHLRRGHRRHRHLTRRPPRRNLRAVLSRRALHRSDGAGNRRRGWRRAPGPRRRGRWADCRVQWRRAGRFHA
jgi:hypothetical protein